jgi:hypothetical protein
MPYPERARDFLDPGQRRPLAGAAPDRFQRRGDGVRDVHNPKFVMQYLIDSIESLGGDVSTYTRP